MCYFGITLIPVAWLIFTLYYTNQSKWSTRRNFIIMSILPVITLAMVWTNNFHHLMWTSISLDTGTSPPVDIAIQGAYWWVHAVYSYSLIGIGIALLFNYYFKVTGIYRKQVSVMLIGAFVPLVANFIYIAKIHLPFEIDPTPMAFTITGIAFFWGLSHIQLFSIMPIAYDTIFKSMNDGVIIVDPFNRIIEANPAASNMLNSKSILVTGTNINRLFSEVVCSTALKTETVPAQLEIEISKETTSRYYDLYISSIFNQNLLKGRILLLHEFTEKRNVAIISRERSLLEQELIERKKVEKALRISEQFNLSVMEYSPNPLFIIDSEGSIKYINPAFEKLSGYSKSEVIGIKRPFPWWPLEERQRFIEASANLPVPDGLFSGERKLNNKSGVQFLVEQHSTHIAGNDGTQYLLATWVDITTRKQNENALAISKEKLQTLTEDAPVMICNVDLEGNIKYVNKMFEKVTRLNRSDVVGKNGFKIGLFSGDVLISLAKRFREKLSKQDSEIIPFEFQIKRQSGDYRWISLIGEPINENGNIVGLQIFGQDVTEKKAAEAMLNESEEKYRTIFESANDIIILLDENGNIVDVNDKLKDLGGWNRKEVIGKNFISLIDIISENSIPVIKANSLKRMAGMTVSPYEVEMIKSNGEMAFIEINATAVRKNGKVIGDLAILRDVTERKKAEIKLKENKDLIDGIMASTPDAVFVTDRDNRIILANSAFYRMFRLQENNAEGQKIEDAICFDGLTEIISNVFNDGTTNRQVELKYIQDGAEKIVIANIIEMEKGKILVILDDVTELRERQATLSVNERLISVGEMAAGMAHELNNPLTSVVGFSQLLLLQENIPDEIKSDLNNIYHEGQRAAAIVKNLLTFARKHPSEKQLVQVNTILEEVLKLRTYEQNVNNIQVKLQFDSQLPLVMCDPFQMQQVFLNLILNAEYAMIQSHNKGILAITTEKSDQIIRITFKDDGSGISPENMKHLFNPFFTTKGVGKGTGLGLSICFGIINNHSGRIYAAGGLSEGATFVVELPIQIKQ